MNRLSKRLRQILAVVIFVPAIAGASINSPIDGVVIDESTGKPIAGAFVIAQWVRYGSDGFGSRTSCPHIEVVQSDDRGRYRIPKTNAWGLGLTRMVFAYKAGYEWFFKGQEPDDRVASMRPFRGSGDERLILFRTYSALRNCIANDQALQQLRPLFAALDHEAMALQVTDPEKNRPGRFTRALQDLAESMKSDEASQKKGR